MRPGERAQNFVLRAQPVGKGLVRPGRPTVLLLVHVHRQRLEEEAQRRLSGGTVIVPIEVVLSGGNEAGQ